MSLQDFIFSKLDAECIWNLKPPGEDSLNQNLQEQKQLESITNILSPSNSTNSIITTSPSKRKHSEEGGEGAEENANVEDTTEYDYVLQYKLSTLPDGSIRCAPKKRRFLKWCADDYAVPVPRTKTPIPFFLMNVDPMPYLEDDTFIESVGAGAPKPFVLQLSNELVSNHKFISLFISYLLKIINYAPSIRLDSLRIFFFCNGAKIINWVGTSLVFLDFICGLTVLSY